MTYLKKQVSTDSVRHMHAVAEFMYAVAPHFGLDADDMYLLGLVHDVGILHGKLRHEEIGAKMLKKFGVNEKYQKIVSCHAMTPKDYKQRYRCKDDGIPKELVLLWWADMVVTADGNTGTYQDRLEQVRIDCGRDSYSYFICKEIIAWLQENLPPLLDRMAKKKDGTKPAKENGEDEKEDMTESKE